MKTEFFKITAVVSRLKEIKVYEDRGSRTWFYSEISNEAARDLDNFPSDLYLEYSNLPFGPEINITQYQEFLQRWGVFNITNVRGTAARAWIGKRPDPTTGGEIREGRFLQVGEDKLPKKLGELGWKIANQGGGFFAIPLGKMWTHHSELLDRVVLWNSLCNGRLDELRKAAIYSWWMAKLRNGFNIPKEEFQYLPQSGWPKEVLIDVARGWIESGFSGLRMELAFNNGQPTLTSDYSDVASVLRTQFLRVVLESTQLIGCRRCKRISEAQRRTRLYCSYDCAHAIAQSNYAKSPKGKKVIKKAVARRRSRGK